MRIGLNEKPADERIGEAIGAHRMLANCRVQAKEDFQSRPDFVRFGSDVETRCQSSPLEGIVAVAERILDVVFESQPELFPAWREVENVLPLGAGPAQLHQLPQPSSQQTF